MILEWVDCGVPGELWQMQCRGQGQKGRRPGDHGVGHQSDHLKTRKSTYRISQSI